MAPRYADIKAGLIRGREDEVRASWERLLKGLREEIPGIVKRGVGIVPEINFKDIKNAPESFNEELKERGVAVVRGVVEERDG